MMIVRCHDPNTKSFEYYGGRGILVCEEWRHNFRAFYEHVGPRPPGTSIDRIDVNRGYEPGNVRWLPVSAQSRNRRNCKLEPHEYDQAAWLVLEGGHRIIDVAKAFACHRSIVDQAVKTARGTLRAIDPAPFELREAERTARAESSHASLGSP